MILKHKATAKLITSYASNVAFKVEETATTKKK